MRSCLILSLFPLVLFALCLPSCFGLLSRALMFDLVFALTCLEYGVAVDLGGELWGVEEEEEKEEIEV